MDMKGLTEALPLEVLPPVLEPLGSSLAAAVRSCRSVAQAAEAGDGAAFRPLTFCTAAASPGMNGAARPSERCGRVARNRQPQSSWRDIARVIQRPAESPASWHEQVSQQGEDWPSHRHSVAVCGAPGDDERAILFGGNVGRSVAMSWRTSSDLYLADLDVEAKASMKLLSQPAGVPSPVSRWGASLTTLPSCCVLWGGWSRDGDTDKPWKLWLREAAPEWSEVHPSSASSPPHVAFHTSSALPDGRMAVVGGLGDGGSHSGVWLFDPLSERWDQAAQDGPACAGHVAGVDTDSQRLVLFGGVQRSRARQLLRDDAFLDTLSVFDVRQQRWDNTMSIRRGFEDMVSGPEPCPRRNAAYGTLGSHLIITGGFSDEQGASLHDTWMLDFKEGKWHELPVHAPTLEGHKAIVSGVDFFTFGGHSAPGVYPRRSISVHRLRLGSDCASSQSENESAACPSENDSVEEEESDNEDEGQTVTVRMQDNEFHVRTVRISVHMLHELLRMQLERDESSGGGPSGGYPSSANS